MSDDFDSLTDLWQQFVEQNGRGSMQISTDQDYLPKFSFSETLEALISEQPVTTEMRDKILVVEFSNGDIFYYDYGQCRCDDEDAKKCNCFTNAKSAIMLQIDKLAEKCCVFCSRLISEDEICFVTTIFHPNDLQDHVNKYEKMLRPSQVQDDQLVFDSD